MILPVAVRDHEYGLGCAPPNAPGRGGTTSGATTTCAAVFPAAFFSPVGGGMPPERIQQVAVLDDLFDLRTIKRFIFE